VYLNGGVSRNTEAFLTSHRLLTSYCAFPYNASNFRFVSKTAPFLTPLRTSGSSVKLRLFLHRFELQVRLLRLSLHRSNSSFVSKTAPFLTPLRTLGSSVILRLFLQTSFVSKTAPFLHRFELYVYCAFSYTVRTLGSSVNCAFPYTASNFRFVSKTAPFLTPLRTLDSSVKLRLSLHRFEL
jgi:hypothetical protein